MKAWEAQALKDYCIECSGSKTQAKACGIKSCKIWPLLPDWHKERTRKREKTCDGVQITIQMYVKGVKL